LLAKQAGLLGDEGVIESCGKRFDALFTALREARNDVAHTGAYARHVAADAVVLCLVLEEALMSKRLTVGDFMVSKPVCVEPWQTVGHARQLMLSNSFSHLPMWDEDKKSWWLLSDTAVASYLRPTWPSDEKKKLNIKAAHAEGLALKEVKPCKPNDLVAKLLKDSATAGLWLVAGDGYPDGHLAGVLSAFELM
jgi:CBS-domain-containing membrane protein